MTTPKPTTVNQLRQTARRINRLIESAAVNYCPDCGMNWRTHDLRNCINAIRNHVPDVLEICPAFFDAIAEIENQLTGDEMRSYLKDPRPYYADILADFSEPWVKEWHIKAALDKYLM